MTFRIDSCSVEKKELNISVFIDEMLVHDEKTINSHIETFMDHVSTVKSKFDKINTYLTTDEYKEGENQINPLMSDVISKVYELFDWCKNLGAELDIPNFKTDSSSLEAVIGELVEDVKSGTNDLDTLSAIRREISLQLANFKDSLEKHKEFINQFEKIKNNPVDIQVNIETEGGTFGYNFEVLRLFNLEGEDQLQLLKEYNHSIKKEISKHLENAFADAREKKNDFKEVLSNADKDYDSILESHTPEQFLILKKKIEVRWYEVFEDQSGLIHYLNRMTDFYKSAKALVDTKLHDTEMEVLKTVRKLMEANSEIEPQVLMSMCSVADLLSGKVSSRQKSNSEKAANTIFTLNFLKLQKMPGYKDFFAQVCKQNTDEFGGDYSNDDNLRIFNHQKYQKIQIYGEKPSPKSKDLADQHAEILGLTELSNYMREYLGFNQEMEFNGNLLVIKDLILAEDYKSR